MPEFLNLLTILVSAITGAILAYLGAIWRTRSQARQFIHEKIHESRSRLYPQAWKLTGQLPLRPKTQQLTYASINELSIALRDWYYQEGGMYLSGGARRAYSDCQDTLCNIVQKQKDVTINIPDDHYEQARKVCSNLRTWLTRDILSRSKAPMSKTPMNKQKNYHA